MEPRLEDTHQRCFREQVSKHTDGLDVRGVVGRRQIPVRLHGLEDLAIDQDGTAAVAGLNAFEAHTIHLGKGPQRRVFPRHEEVEGVPDSLPLVGQRKLPGTDLDPTNAVAHPGALRPDSLGHTARKFPLLGEFEELELEAR
ncbi:MAG: hypothetical protein P8Y94_14695 [Acidobacteriota bacterium]